MWWNESVHGGRCKGSHSNWLNWWIWTFLLFQWNYVASFLIIAPSSNLCKPVWGWVQWSQYDHDHNMIVTLLLPGLIFFYPNHIQTTRHIFGSHVCGIVTKVCAQVCTYFIKFAALYCISCTRYSAHYIKIAYKNVIFFVRIVTSLLTLELILFLLFAYILLGGCLNWFKSLDTDLDQF